ncbi:hypothetical protein S7711_10314 [Stachybotrys chartarum IBT 7711]|uniref:Uncharacterized protein n=1 Tax=Stachybotrys chartarum (strain CBS 109288 / IBT 7711) TaxID=1280523 RepID=A0A084B5V0_STACB|nr:hypothetical protein S7711_10314 [Stachybotrys chartarum IBT 7711]
MRTQGWGTSSGHGRLWEVMTGMEFILDHLEDWKAFGSGTCKSGGEVAIPDTQPNTRATITPIKTTLEISRVRDSCPFTPPLSDGSSGSFTGRSTVRRGRLACPFSK